MVDERYEMASQYADNLRAKAEELSMAIHEARKMGYDTVVRIRGGFMQDENEKGLRIVGVQNIDASVAFDIGRAV